MQLPQQCRANPPPSPVFRYSRAKDVRQRYRTSIATIWRWARDEIIPPPIQLGGNSTAWITAELDRVDAAREAGRSRDEIKALIHLIVAERRTAYEGGGVAA